MLVDDRERRQLLPDEHLDAFLHGLGLAQQRRDDHGLFGDRLRHQTYLTRM